MKVQGCDCSIVIKTIHREMDIPYSEETIREAIFLLHEEVSIEGDGINRAIHKSNGVTGCIVTPLTIGTAPLLLYLAMGSAGLPVFVSETRDLYQYQLNLLPLEDTDCFDLVQDRGKERRLFEACRVKVFELRVNREETLKLKLDICGERSPTVYPYTDKVVKENEERFNGDCVSYKINGKDYGNIYGFTLLSKKEGGTKTELWIKRVMDTGSDIPEIIDEIVIAAKLLRDKYEERHFGTFRITIKRLVLTSDETFINTADTVIGPLRYYVSGTVTTEVFTSGEVTL
ncbi:MAG: biotin transporter BioY [Treponema sp.]|jgi:hypothetical protein|nr:biotin transporter BioY [Treponema sp.]